MGSLMDIPTLFRIWMFALVFFFFFFNFLFIRIWMFDFGCFIFLSLISLVGNYN